MNSTKSTQHYWKIRRGKRYNIIYLQTVEVILNIIAYTFFLTESVAVSQFGRNRGPSERLVVIRKIYRKK